MTVIMMVTMVVITEKETVKEKRNQIIDQDGPNVIEAEVGAVAAAATAAEVGQEVIVVTDTIRERTNMTNNMIVVAAIDQVKIKADVVMTMIVKGSNIITAVE